MNKLWGNYGGFGKVGVEVYRNFIPNGVLMRVIRDLGVTIGRIRVSDLNFKGVSGVEQLAAGATIITCPKM